MGVFLYCNQSVETKQVQKVFETRGHKDIGSQIVEGETLVYAGKTLTETTTFLRGKELGSSNSNDYIIGIGTFFIDGLFGEEALKKVYEKLDKVIKDNLVYGHWAFVVRKNGTTYVFNDMSGTLRLYYTEKDGRLVISSSPLAIIATMQNPKFDKVLMSAFLAGHYGRDVVPVSELLNIDPLKYIKVDRGKVDFVKRDVPTVNRVETLDDAINLVKGLFDQQINQLKAIGDERVSIELTAGLDSRLITANLRKGGFNYEFLNYPLFGPDKEVASLIANALQKRLIEQTNERCTDYFEEHFGEWDFGFDFFRPYYANNRWKVENRIQFSGGRGECLDLPDIYSDENVKMMEDPRLKTLMEPLTTTSMMNGKRKKEYLEYMWEFFSSLGYPVDTPLTEYQQLTFCQNLCGQRTGDYMYNSGVQAHIFFYQIYNEWHFNHFISDIAFKAKSGRKLTLALIKDIDPELGSFPFVSRRRTKRKSVNETQELPLQYWSYNGIKDMLPKFVVDFIYKRMGRVYSKDKLANIEFDYYSDVVNTEDLKRYPNLYSDILNRMYSIEIIRKIMGIEF